MDDALNLWREYLEDEPDILRSTNAGAIECVFCGAEWAYDKRLKEHAIQHAPRCVYIRARALVAQSRPETT